MYVIYRTAPFSMTLNYPYAPSFKVTPFFDAEYLKNGTRYKHSFNGILIGTYTCHTPHSHFEWAWVTYIYIAKYSMTRSVARSLCDSWVFCWSRGHLRVVLLRRCTKCCALSWPIRVHEIQYGRRPPSCICLGKSWNHPRRSIHGGYFLWKFRHDRLSSVQIIGT